MSISGIYALTNQETEGALSTGVVDIKLQTYKLNSDGDEVLYGEDSTVVMPGDQLSLIPKIENLGEDCYVRVKINYIDSDTNFLDYITGFSSNLTKYGDYYYYNDVLSSGDKFKLFDTIQIPESLTKEDYDGKIKLEIVAEAIQDRHFEPDYSLEDPWKNITPTESSNSTYDIDTGSNVSKITIVYEDETINDVTVKNEFFKEMKIVMPGDEYSDSIDIKNTKNTNATYYLKIVTDKNDNNESSLLSNVNLTITNSKGQVLYSGSLMNSNKFSLGEFKQNESDKLTFKITVPAELGNEFSLLNPKLYFVFSSEYEDESGSNEESGKNSINPKTGDKIDMALTIFLISSICLLTVVILAYIEKRKKNID